MEKSKTRQSINGQITFSGKSQTTYRNEYDYFQMALDKMQIAVKGGKLDISKFLKKHLAYKKVCTIIPIINYKQ